ncbi:non-hydrolyzing UDP-N-acetylglucosamine 2-epimerase [Thiomicrorhabdus lithotrophica]|uniref:UDP-N-acetylglucosamine 2-epimerase (Non-hydrolyzing) n=1 Tax=Thiomicrorhabdus lithotrophica TaxID=2949997 RepID=A0ABY8CB08_9GAMM|nr:UDP-N-acetylglucosamine 2-epimerase (non-hydrolyzing) [Thiomicrorhabdus lithotrophica]WEJ63149.1 UDP-N-acetylglucosamine 2-epimerase (non-hydrolyzing) [Thiomicrorhabdus lithotrophica]
MKIVTISGARPQFIKAGSVSREILRQADSGADIHQVIVHTGQHYDENMSDVFFEEMQIPKPDYFLGIGGKTHGAMTGQMIEKIEEILVQEKPNWVMVYGDTNSTLAGAIAASKLHIKIAHVEAGLRSFNMRMPEEVNRILTDRVSSLLFCPTQAALDNLANEGVEAWSPDANVVLSGDVMQDGAMFYRELAQKPPGLVISEDFVLCTIHRAENTDDPVRLANIVSALNDIAKEKQVVLPLHPRTKSILQASDYDTSNLTITDPVGYLNMVWLIDHCDLVMTDSGGLQKEAFFFEKPCITLRDETEWIELVDNGFNKLAGADKAKIIELYYGAEFNTDFTLSLYGGGLASECIVMELLSGCE